MFVPPGVPRTSGRCVEDFLKLICLVFLDKSDSQPKIRVRAVQRPYEISKCPTAKRKSLSPISLSDSLSTYTYVYVYIYTHIYIYLSLSLSHAAPRKRWRQTPLQIHHGSGNCGNNWGTKFVSRRFRDWRHPDVSDIFGPSECWGRKCGNEIFMAMFVAKFG